MSLEFRIDGTLLDADRVEIDGVAGLPAAAWIAEPMTAGVRVEDPDGDLDLIGWHEFTVDETACDLPRVFTGLIQSRRISRGTYRTAAGRVWDCDIVDQNALFGLKVFRASSAKRPAETDLARMDFMVNSAPMASNPVFEGTLTNFTDNPIAFAEANYVTQYPVHIIDSVAGVAGKNAYAFYNDTTNQIELYYDQFGAQLRNAQVSVSNVIADVNIDPDCYYPFIDAELTRSPYNTNAGILLEYISGFVYGQRPQTITDFIDRDVVYRTDRIGKVETANAVLAAMLEAQSVEEDTVVFTIRVPASKVNHAHAGMWIDCRFTHLPGLGTTTALPIIRRNVTTVPGRRDLYDIRIEASKKAPSKGPGSGVGSVFPHRPSCEEGFGEIVTGQEFNGVPSAGPSSTFDASLPGAPTPGNTVIIYMASRLPSPDDPDIPDGFLDVGPGLISPHETVGRVAYRHVESGDTATIAHWGGGSSGTPPTSLRLEERTGLLNISATSGTNDVDPGHVAGTDFPGAAITPTSGLPGVVVGFVFMKRDQALFTAGTGYTLLNARKEGAALEWAAVEKIITSTSGSYTPQINCSTTQVVFDDHDYGQITIAFTCEGADQPPATGQWIYGEAVATGDGTTVTFTTAWPFIEGSLRVYYDLVDQTGAILSTDNEAGTFTMAGAPLTGWQVTVDYQAL